MLDVVNCSSQHERVFSYVSALRPAHDKCLSTIINHIHSCMHWRSMRLQSALGEVMYWAVQSRPEEFAKPQTVRRML